jgi:hypothetical protein
MAIAAIINLFRAQLLNLVEEPEASPEHAARRRGLLDMVDLSAFRSGDETARWIAYLASLGERKIRGEVTATQERRFLETWRSARTAFPLLRHPSVTRTDDGRLHLGWSFADRPGVTLTIDVEPDGRIDWFYCNASDNRVCGTEDEPESELPEEALNLLTHFTQ